MTAQTRFVTSKDGTHLACHVSGSGKPLLLIYGALSDITYWRRLAPLLSGYELHLLERRGRGESGNTPVYTVQHEIDDVTAVLESFPQPPLVFGHSAGALLALLAASASPQSTRALALYEPPLITGTSLRPPVSPGVPERLAELAAAGRREEALELFFREGPRLSEEDIQRQQGSPLWLSLLPLAHTAAYDVQIASQPYPAPVPALSSLPVLLLYGDQSPAWMTEGVRLLADSLPRSETQVLAGQGHAAAFTDPTALAHAITRFFDCV